VGFVGWVGAQAHHLGTRRLRSSLTQLWLRALRCSVPDADLAHLNTNSLDANRQFRAKLARNEMGGPLLQVQGLRTYFATRAGVVRAVDGVDLELTQGRTLGLVGESGCGKSVTSLSIMRLIDPPGRIEPGSSVVFDGHDLIAADEDELRQVRGNEISMIFQEPMTSLNPVYSVGDQIAEAVRLHQGVSQSAARARASEMLELVGIPSPERRLHDYPHQMSGGMRQRVMIAMALSCGPKLLIADEPTTALDVTIQAQILELMRELRDRFGMAILLITHDLGVVAEMADEVAVMYAGRVVERGPVASIFESPQHPYTEALLQSIPILGMTQAEPLRVIRGLVPSPMSWPPGCRFASRCDYAFDRCRQESPPLFQVQPQESACWLCEHGRRAVATRSA
jgi:oligopeptide/dipeptide ABC transporter ATP-binding protein